MAAFGDLPAEMHLLIARCCSDVGHHVLTKFSLLNRYLHSLARPLLSSSADLTHLKDDEHKLQLFTHHFAPPLRSKLVKLSLTLGRSQIFCEYTLEEGLDDIYSNILSLLPLLQTLQFTLSSDLAKDELERGDFALTFKAAARLKYWETLTISGDLKHLSSASKDSSGSLEFVQHMLFDCLPKFKRLKKLTLERLDIALPHDLPAQYPKLDNLTHLNLESVRLRDTLSSHKADDPLYRFINFFSTGVESVLIHDLTIGLALQPRPIFAPRLYHLSLSVITTSQQHGDRACTSALDHVEHEQEEVYRRVLEYCSHSSDLESIRVCEPVGMNQFVTLSNTGKFKNVFRINHE